MLLKTCLNWLRYSGVWVGFVINPYHWEPDFKILRNSEYENWGVVFIELNLGLVWIRIIIDDGRW